MPWFGKSARIQLKSRGKRQRIRKGDISEPRDFKVCYHATFEGADGFKGLPPQWSCLISSPPNNQDIDGVENVTELREVNLAGATACSVSSSSDNVSGCPTPATGSTGTVTCTNSEAEAGMCVPPNSATGSSTSLSGLTVRRPSPIIRGSDSCLEETIKYIKKHYRSISEDATEPNEEFLDIHFVSRSRAGSLMQLHGPMPQNQTHGTSYSSGSASTVNSRSNDALPAPSALCLSAPNDIARSDLGLYNCVSENISECGMNLSHSRINSPSESSGYFGSTRSSLNSSRVSSTQHISSPAIQNTHQNVTFSPSRPLTQTYEAHEHHWSGVHPQLHHIPHRFSSLQRPLRQHREMYSHRSHAIVTNFPAGHYGTTPRPHKGGSAVGSQSLESAHHIHERERGDYGQVHHETLVLKHSSPLTLPSISCTLPHSSQHQHVSAGHKRELRKTTHDEFRTALEHFVNPSDPRKDLHNFIKIGEGSTGVVFTAQQVSKGITVAVKKMHLWRQQRRELLFNEVKGRCGTCISGCGAVTLIYIPHWIEYACTWPDSSFYPGPTPSSWYSIMR